MRTIVQWVLVGVMATMSGARYEPDAPLVLPPPAQRQLLSEGDRVIRLHVEYDQSLVQQHGDGVETFIREAVAIHNAEWRRYRRDWFELASLTFRSSGSERDASYVLANFLLRTHQQPDAIHILITGRPLEVYSGGTRAIPIGGLAYRSSDAVVISATAGVNTEHLGYYLFHELGHCWDALDLPFLGGDTTFGSKTRMNFHLDAGNEEILEASPGPLPRDTPKRAPMVIREKLAAARAAARGAKVYPTLHDLMLHEPSPANGAYVAKKRALLIAAGADRERIETLLRRYEITPQQVREDAELRQRLAEHYWRANDAIRNRDYDAAELEMAEIRNVAISSPEVHMLAGAVQRKIRKRR